MWEKIQWVGEDNWVAGAIERGSCTAVTDGLYMKSLYPNIHLAAFVLECSRGSGRLWGSFLEACQNSCSYREELVGLMAIHLILLAVNGVNDHLSGAVHIYSDCLGALDKVKNLSPSCIPTRSSHLDILKNILVNCSNLSFDRFYSHVAAYQDDQEEYRSLSRLHS
jgi:hypothetical protein